MNRMTTLGAAILVAESNGLPHTAEGLSVLKVELEELLTCARFAAGSLDILGQSPETLRQLRAAMIPFGGCP